MRISVVTVSFNSADTIGDTLASVASQSHPDVEHIIVDGGSTDDTVAIAMRFPHVARIVSEPDAGIYDAMNKGWRLATGDLIGWLNADDMYAHSGALASIVDAASNGAVVVAGSVDMVAASDIGRTVRRYSAKNFQLSQINFGFLPPHPGFYIQRNTMDAIGGYDLTYRVAADIDIMVRALYKYRLPYTAISEPVVKMRMGGLSSGLRSKLTIFNETHHSLRQNAVPTNRFVQLYKYIYKAMQYI